MNNMKKTLEKTLTSFLSFSVFLLLVTFSFDHINAQNSGDLSPAAKEAFIQTMNEEIIDLRIEMNDPGVNAGNNLAIFDYYIAVRDYYLNNPVELQDAFEIQLWKFEQYDITIDLSEALMDKISSPSGTLGSVTNVSGSPSPVTTTSNFTATTQFKTAISQLEIIEIELLGFNSLFDFIRSHK